MSQQDKTLSLGQFPNEYITVIQFGAKGDGSTDDTAALYSAIQYASLNNIKLFWNSGTYNISGNINTPSAYDGKALNIEFDADVNIILVGTSRFVNLANRQVLPFYTTGANTVNFTGGNVFINLNNYASNFLTCRNYPVNNNSFKIDCSKFEINNVYSNAGDLSASIGILVYGAYENLVLKSVFISNVSRDISLNSYSSEAIVIRNFEGKAVIENCVFQNIGNVNLSADCDCISVFGINNGTVGVYATGDFTIQNCVFKNSRGRFIKSQSSDTKVYNCEFYQTDANYLSINNGSSIDFQKSNGTAIGNKFYFYKDSGNPTTSTQYAPIACQSTLDNTKQVFRLFDNTMVSDNITYCFLFLIDYSPSTNENNCEFFANNNQAIPANESVTEMFTQGFIALEAPNFQYQTGVFKLFVTNNKCLTQKALVGYSFNTTTPQDFSNRLVLVFKDNRNTSVGTYLFIQYNGQRVTKVNNFQFRNNIGWSSYQSQWDINLANNANYGDNEYTVALSSGGGTIINGPSTLPTSGTAIIKIDDTGYANYQCRSILVNNGTQLTSKFFNVTGTWIDETIYGNTLRIPVFSSSNALKSSNFLDAGSYTQSDIVFNASAGIGIGVTTLTNTSLRARLTLTGTKAQGIVQDGFVQTTVTNNAVGFTNVLNVVDSVFTLPDYYHFYAYQALPQGSATVTTQSGYVAQNLYGATNNYGYDGQLNVGSTNIWNLYMRGTAPNYLRGSLGIGSTNINASAALQISSSTQGFLPPIMTTTQKNAISSPATGLVVFDSTLGKLCVYGGSAWQTITSV